MAGSHRLEARRLLGGDGGRRRGQLALVGAALVALSAPVCLAQAADEPEQSAQPEPRRNLEAEWKALVEAVEAAPEDRRQEAIAAVHAWYAECSGLGVQMGGFAYQLAQNQEWTSDPELRIAYWKDLVDAHGSLGSAENALQTAVMPASLLFKAGRFADAAAYTEEVLERFGEARPTRDNHLVRLAEARRELGQFDEALDALDRLDALQPPSTDEALRVRSLLIRGLIYTDLGLPDRATPYVAGGLRLAEERFAEGTSPPNEITTARRVGLLLDQAEADHEGVVAKVEELLQDPSYARDPGERGRLQVFLGTSLLKLRPESSERLEKATEVLHAALSLGLEPEFECQARLGLVDAALRRGAYAGAREELDAVAGVIDGAQGSEKLAQAIADAATYETRLALDRGASREELRRLEAPLVEAIERLIAVWAQVPERPGGVGFLLYNQRRNAIAERLRLIRALEPESGDEAALSYLLRMQALGTLARREDVPVPTLEDIRQSLLDEGHGLLVYLPAEERTYAFAIDRDGLLLESLGPGTAIDSARRDYVRYLLSSGGELSGAEAELLVRGERRLAHVLADTLLDEPLRERILHWKRLTVAGSDVLGPVPFEWLPIGDERYLGLERAVAYLPSIPLGVSRARARDRHEQEREAPADWDILLMAATSPGHDVRERWPETVDLPFTEADRRELLRPYDASRSSAMIGDHATLASLARFNLGRARVLQFLGHAVRDFSRERSVALVFAPDDSSAGLAWCEQVEQLSAPELVVLTACRSGLGKQRRGDPGMTDMGGAWIAQGARAVVVASTDLQYGQALSASGLFHERLVAGDSPAEALRAVRERTVQGHPDTAPLLGGLLHVVGLGHEPLFEGSRGDAGGDALAERLPLTAIGIATAGLAIVALWALLRARRRDVRRPTGRWASAAAEPAERPARRRRPDR